MRRCTAPRRADAIASRALPARACKQALRGAGEPTAAVVPSAIGNAIYDATGARVRSVPFTPDKVLAALKTT